MSRHWKIALILAAILLLVFSVSLAWSAPQNPGQPKLPVFSAKDHQIIEEHYNHVIGELAPGSVNRSPFPLGVEAALVPGSHVPMQLEKDLQPLPSKLDQQLSQITGDYGRYILGRHVVLVRKGDLAIGDIIRNIAVTLK
ncbi:MAG TPA: hypothetical protein VKY31_10735 [Terriglobia bacterium]|nr:hypothetical protein [Terriglobia bacterium]